MDTYEKKYKEAQKWIESIYPNLSHEQQMEAEAFFSELAESEDERIRKEIITHCRNTRCVTEEGAERIAKWIDWLEKQGEEKVQAKSLWHEYNDKIDLNRPFLLITPKGQLSIMSWNGKCLRSVTFGGGGGIILEGDRFAYIDELQEIQNPAEWSEEDEIKIKSIIAFLKSPSLCAMDGNKGIIDANIKYLKFLKGRVRPQNTWKPSEEQMNVLWDKISNDNLPNSEKEISQQVALTELYEQLKKLKRE